MDLDATPGQLCDICGESPIIGILQYEAEDGATVQKGVCQQCLGDTPLMAVGSLLQRMAAPDAAGQQAATAGPVSHPDPSDEVRALVHDAMFLAANNTDRFCDTTHLLGALLRTQPGRAALVDAGLRTNFEQFARGYAERVVPLDVGAGPSTSMMVPFSPSATAAVRLASKLAARERSSHVELRHIINGLLANQADLAGAIMREAGAVPTAADASGRTRRMTAADQGAAAVEQPAHAPTPALDAFGRDLTRYAADGRIDPVIGRTDEIEQVVEILARRRKNNPVLIGEPGVGKTAIVEGLALRIVNDDVPQTLTGKRLVALDVASMIAGTNLRGEFEKRLKSVLDEVTASDGRIILFIDELHTIVGAGSAEGSMDAANMLKPALARGDMQTVGATTLTEYRNIERDGALARRFQTVTVNEPGPEDTVSILRGLKDAYEDHHKAHYTDAALLAAVRLSDRYLTEFHQPDKAIDLLDQAGARVRLHALAPSAELASLREELDAAHAAKDAAVAAEAYDDAQEHKANIEALHERLLRLEADARAAQPVLQVTEADVTAVIAKKTGIPVGELMTDELDRLRHLESDLHERVVGQDAAVTAVADAVRRSRAGLASNDEPIGTFFLLGPTGVGKTELAKTVAQRLFGTQDALVRIDMSEYAQEHNVARLIGSPPGYVGHGKGGQLTEPVRRRPYSVVLIDEFEKAHPSVWNLFLQVMDDGRLTDGEGRTTDFRNTIIMFTSNIAAGKAKRPIGFTGTAASAAGQNTDELIAAAKRVLPPEFYNRIDDAVVFNPLTAEQAALITHKLCTELAAKLAPRGIELSVSDELVAKLAADGFDEEYGGRPLRRHLRRTLEKALTDMLIDGSLADGHAVSATLADDGTVTLHITATAPDAAPVAA